MAEEEKTISAEKVAAYKAAQIAHDGSQSSVYARMHARFREFSQAIYSSDAALERNYSHLVDLQKSKAITQKDRTRLYHAIQHIDETLNPNYFSACLENFPEFVPSEQDVRFLLSVTYHLLSDNEDMQRDGNTIRGGAVSKSTIFMALKTLGLGESLSAEQALNVDFTKRLEKIFDDACRYHNKTDSLRK